MTERRLWTHQEDTIILKLVHLHGPKNWTLIAQEMKANYSEFARTSKQIRERHKQRCLDLVVIVHHLRGPQKDGKQVEIDIQTAHFKGRTDNSIKNHFYSTLRRSLRRINKYLGFKNSTNQMRVLKPSILCKLIQDANNNIEFRTLIDCIFQFSKFKPNKTTKTDDAYFVGNQKKILKQAIEKLTEFNFKYNRNERISKNKTTKNNNKNFQKQHFQQSATDLDQLNNENELRIKIQEQLNCGEQETSKGQKSSKYHEENEQKLGMNQLPFEDHWQESNNNQFVELFPQLERPDHDHDQQLIHFTIECKQQEIL